MHLSNVSRTFVIPHLHPFHRMNSRYNVQRPVQRSLETDSRNVSALKEDTKTLQVPGPKSALASLALAVHTQELPRREATSNKTDNGPATSDTGPATSDNGPATSYNGPATSDTGPATSGMYSSQ